MMEDWNNESRTKRTFRAREKMQCKLGAMPDAENVTVRFALVSIIPTFQYSNIPHPYGMLMCSILLSVHISAMPDLDNTDDKFVVFDFV